jgi:hypothetical protein
MDIKLQGDPRVDKEILLKLDKKTLLKLCEQNHYVLDLCNNDEDLYEKITIPSV